MGIDIGIHGTLTSKIHRRVGREAAEAILKLAEEWWGDDLLGSSIESEDGETTIHLLTHPLAEPMQIRLVRPAAVEAEARTSSAGPGYHQRVCEFAHHLGGTFGIDWSSEAGQDETGFFETGNRDQLEAAMLQWLQALCRSCLEHMTPGDSLPKLCMPMAEHFHTPGLVQTPTGPRTIEWLEKVGADPTGAEAISFFSSWSAERTPQEVLARALGHMWMDIHWAPPQSEHSEHIMVLTADLLAEAYRADPTLGYPWSEWGELLEFLDRQDDPLFSIVQDLAASSARHERIGYRRGLVTSHDAPGPWSITLPGRFETQWEDEGTWLATDGQDVLRMSGYEIETADDQAEPAVLLRNVADDAEIIDQWRSDDHDGALVVTRAQEEDEEFWVVYACIRRDRHYAQVTIITAEDPRAEWIRAASRSAFCSADD
jgi:hypothetical protein